MTEAVAKQLIFAMWRHWRDAAVQSVDACWRHIDRHAWITTPASATTTLDPESTWTVDVASVNQVPAVRKARHAFRQRIDKRQQATQIATDHNAQLATCSFEQWFVKHRGYLRASERNLLEQLWSSYINIITHRQAQFTHKWLAWLTRRTKDLNEALNVTWPHTWNATVQQELRDMHRRHAEIDAMVEEYNGSLGVRILNMWISHLLRDADSTRFASVVQRIVLDFAGARIQSCTTQVSDILSVALGALREALDTHEAAPTATRAASKPLASAISSSDVLQASIAAARPAMARMMSLNQSGDDQRWVQSTQERVDAEVEAQTRQRVEATLRARTSIWHVHQRAKHTIEEVYQTAMVGAAREEERLRNSMREVLQPHEALERRITEQIDGLREQVKVAARDMVLLCDSMAAECEVSALRAFWGP